MSGVNPMWNAMLKWSIAQDDGLGNGGDVKPLSKKDQEWLTKVMDSMVVDQAKRIKIVTSVLKMPLDAKALRGVSDKLGQLEEYKVAMNSETSDKELITMLKSKKEEALEELDGLVENIDNAIDLHTLKGLKPLIEHLGSPFLSLRWRAANALSTTVQNNPKPQAWAVELGAVPALVARMSLDQKVDLSGLPDFKDTEAKDTKLMTKVAIKTVLALSSLLRYNPAGEAQFLELGGIDRLVSLLNDPRATNRLQRKLVSVLSYFWREARHRQTAAVAIPTLIKCLASKDIDVRESSLNALMLVVDQGNHTQNLALAMQPELGLQKHVTTRLKTCAAFGDPEDVEQVEEEVATLQRLAKVLSARL